MDPPDLESHDSCDLDGNPSDPAGRHAGMGPGDADAGAFWLEEIVARLEADPDERWPAIESLSAVDDEARLEVIAALAAYRERPAIRDLLGLLSSAGDPAVRAAADRVLSGDRDPAAIGGPACGNGDGQPGAVCPASEASLPMIPAERERRDLAGQRDHPAARIVRSLVTAIDGEGRATVVLSAGDGGYRRTAAFRTDVRRGILDVAGEVEREQPSAGRLVDECADQADGQGVLDAPELAVRLLEGCLLLGGPQIPAPVRAWLEATVGPETLGFGLATDLPGPEFEGLPDEELSMRADLVLDACPGWLDRSPLTFEMAAEIALREGDARPDPVRDAGAYRYLFEHRLIDRLELFARMLLWMGWVWRASGRLELSRSAFAFAGQLSDEQYAVPSHPFTVALSTRSLRAAQDVLLRGNPAEGGPGVGGPRAR
jgi:hypothetical protein